MPTRFNVGERVVKRLHHHLASRSIDFNGKKSQNSFFSFSFCNIPSFLLPIVMRRTADQDSQGVAERHGTCHGGTQWQNKLFTLGRFGRRRCWPTLLETFHRSTSGATDTLYSDSSWRSRLCNGLSAARFYSVRLSHLFYFLTFFLPK